jgi:hypothetical protein
MDDLAPDDRVVIVARSGFAVMFPNWNGNQSGAAINLTSPDSGAHL